MKAPLTQLEEQILNEVIECSEQAMQTNEIREYISGHFNLSKHAASGHLGKIAEKGYIKSVSYRDVSIGKITQFRIL